MLGWFVDKDQVEDIVKYPQNLIEETSVEVHPEHLPDAVLDENVDIHLIRRFFSNDAWLHVKDVTARKRCNPIYVCKVCRKDLDEFPSIVCEHCLSWFHMKCVGLKDRPKARHWFCQNCHSP